MIPGRFYGPRCHPACRAQPCRLRRVTGAHGLPYSSFKQSAPECSLGVRSLKQRSQSVTPYSCRVPGQESPSSHLGFMVCMVPRSYAKRNIYDQTLLQQNNPMLPAAFPHLLWPDAGLHFPNMRPAQKQHTEPRLANATADRIGQFSRQQHLMIRKLCAL